MSPFSNVTADPVANVYFDGNVVSHTIHLTDGSRKTLGIIYPGSYHFGTAAAEKMEITSGACQVTIDGSSDTHTYQAGESFDVAANSGFTISVDSSLCQYICSFIEA
jgi:purine/pyrimidine-nucleoside phosphorylase